MSTAETYRQPGANRLLAGLPSTERDRLVPLLEPVVLEVAQVLYAANQPITYVYFPLNSLVSLLVLMDDGGVVEVGAVGYEGMVGLPVFLGANSTAGQATVQIAGQALRMPTETFVVAVLERDGPVYRALHRYTQALFVQATQGAACNRLHSEEQRFCRWMLMIHDQVGRDSFMLAHEFIAQMLGVAHKTVVEVAAAIQKAGLISYKRGTIAILDRHGLEARTCECYWVIRAEFERVAG